MLVVGWFFLEMVYTGIAAAPTCRIGLRQQNKVAPLGPFRGPVFYLHTSGAYVHVTPAEISEAEIKIIRWGVSIFSPLLVAGFIGVVGFLFGVNGTLAQLKGEHETYNANDTEVQDTLRRVELKLEERAIQQQKIEVFVGRMDATQQSIKEQVTDLKTQNAEILRLLRRQVSP